jgi:hypothetical protein
MTLTSLALMPTTTGTTSGLPAWSAPRRGSATSSVGVFRPNSRARWGAPEEDAQRSLGEDTYRRARAEGYAMDSEEAVAYALGDNGGRQ